jgi:hypothetical protein
MQKTGVRAAEDRPDLDVRLIQGWLMLSLVGSLPG